MTRGAIVADARVVVAACLCTGVVGLSARIGVPVVLVDAIDAAWEPASLPARLNAESHGAVVCGADGGRAEIARGWDDWSLLPIVPGGGGCLALVAGARFHEGVIEVTLPPAATLEDFRAGLKGALRHLGLVRVLDRRGLHPLERGLRSAPRYTRWRAPDRSVRVEPADDLYVLDPMEPADARRLFWLVVSARMAVAVGCKGDWR